MLLVAIAGFAGCGDNNITGEDIPPTELPGFDTLDGSNTETDSSERPDVESDADTICVAGFGFEGEMDDAEGGVHIWMSTTQTRSVPVFYRDCNGDDADRAISFELLDGEAYCQLDVTTAYTGEDGIAYGSVKSFQNRGYCHIKACVYGSENDCVEITVFVDPKGIPPLKVEFDVYGGMYPMLKTAKVRIFKKDAEHLYECASLDRKNLPPATIESANVMVIGGQVIFKSLPGLETELAQDYTIVALAYEQDSDLVRAWACDDTNGHVEYGNMKTVVLTLIDIPPSIIGSYDIDSNFDLTSGLPPTVDKILDILIGLFTSPTGQLLMLMCDETILGINIGTDICGYIFADAEDPVLGEYGTIGSFVVGIIDAIIENLLKNNCPYENDPSLCEKIYFGGKDVGAILQKFRIKSTMTCTKDPGPDGIIALGDCKEVWHTVIFRWSLGKDCDPADDECGAVYFSMAAIPGIGNAIRADISGKLIDGTYLQIDPHPVNLKYGALINFALEKILLPQIFGDGTDSSGLPAVDSYEALIGSLLAGRQCLQTMSCCSDFDATLVAKYTWLPAGIAEGACDALMTTVVGYIRDQLNGLDGTPDNFRVGTPIDDPAHMIDTDRNMEFDTIGNKMEQCDWDANLIIGSYTYDPIGRFWGIRN